MKLFVNALTAALIILGVDAASAQTKLFEKFLKHDAEQQKKQGVGEEELAQFEAVLNGSDTDRALRAMRFMLKSGKPQLIRRAKEFGLFSSEQIFRTEALMTIFNEGGPFRAEIDLTVVENEKSYITTLINDHAGSYNREVSRGYITFGTKTFDEKLNCWEFANSGRCAFFLANSSVSLKGWYYGSGNLTLGSDGILRGTIRSRNYSPVPVEIPLIE